MTVDWESYRQCPVCFAELGKPCIKFYAVVADLAEMVEDAEEPHTGRKLRAGR